MSATLRVPEKQLRSLSKNRFALGSPAQVVDALLAPHKAGVTHATMRVAWPGMRQDDILAGIELLGREVLPEVRRRLPAPRRRPNDLGDPCHCHSLPPIGRAPRSGPTAEPWDRRTCAGV